MADNKRKNSEYERAERVFGAHLARQGLKLTSQRRVVLRAVMTTHEHFSVEELYRTLKQEHGGISLASLYRTMPILVEAGLVQAVRFADETRYEHCFGHANHDHLVCLDCGKIIEIEEREMDKVERQASQANDFRPMGRSLVIRGYCRSCHKRGKRLLLSELSRGDMGVITGLLGGAGMVSRLQDMGLRLGKRVIKISTMFGGGPVVVQVEGTQVAVGKGMARRIEVELEE